MNEARVHLIHNRNIKDLSEFGIASTHLLSMDNDYCTRKEVANGIEVT